MAVSVVHCIASRRLAILGRTGPCGLIRPGLQSDRALAGQRSCALPLPSAASPATGTTIHPAPDGSERSDELLEGNAVVRTTLLWGAAEMIKTIQNSSQDNV